MSVHGIKRTGQPITVKISRQMADHTMVEAVFVESDDDRVLERSRMLLDLFDERMVAANEKIMQSTARINAAVDAVLAERTKLNGGADGGPSRPAHVPADS